ncbi:MAG: thrombospondin type 3 repeat-containing protein, partial [Lutibacter sp.]|nr:thrombospondin type 3 repeat-containing protein [Lutibacter sp.]
DLEEKNGLTEGVLHAVQSIDGGYTVEMAIPWNNLDITSANGKTIGFDISNIDNDNGSNYYQLIWSGNNLNYGTTINFGELTIVLNDDDSDGITDDLDLCPNTPTGESVDENGCSESQKDDDNDGVMNVYDLCPNTLSGASVDATGCFVLPSNNFEIGVMGETCPNKDNGQIIITAQSTYPYETTINGVSSNFTTNLIVDSLAPGVYDFCTAVTGETYEQCYTVEIIEGTTVSGKASLSSKKIAVEIIKGTGPYSVFVNGDIKLETLSNSFMVDVKHGDIVEVKTAIQCEGVFSKIVNLFEEIIAYPNPTSGLFEITLPIALNEIKIDLFTANFSLVSTKTYPVINGKVQLNIESLPSAVYVAKVYLENPVSVQIIKN